MPWREDTSPYAIFVSEIMLQQTQVSRVEKYFAPFRTRFPDFALLAAAPLEELLAAWKGLGYNRRAINMREAARVIVGDYAGKLPADPEELVRLPGIGPNTAGSIAAFAYNIPAVFIETNIRRVFIAEFFPRRDDVHDRELLPLIRAALPRDNPRVWYWALMDYGVSLKSEGRAANRRSRHYARQSGFDGSVRQLRGEILRQLDAAPTGREELDRRIRAALPGHPYDADLLAKALEALGSEGFVTAEPGDRYRLAD
jgi:A/G-specific adenine glycosylase